MTEKLKNFFKNKKTDAAFKRAGPGYRLDGTPAQSIHSSGGSSSSSYEPIYNRSGLSQESQQAAEAALARLNKQNNKGNMNRSLAAVKAKVRKEIEAEINSAASKPQHKKVPVVEYNENIALGGQSVYFECPLIGPEILSQEEWNKKVREFLYSQINEEKGLVACLIIQTLNKSKPKVDACIDTIKKYFENILQNPSDEKYRKIRISNKVFQERVLPVEGALLIFEAAGFEIKELPFEDRNEEFLVFPDEKLSDASEKFEILVDGLISAKPITLELHRDIRVFIPSKVDGKTNKLPSSFFNLTIDEIKREQILRTEAVEKSQMLRTKAMRERDGVQEMRHYKYTLIRIHFPDEVFLQGTFGVYEKASSVLEFVKEALDDGNLTFSLKTSTGQNLIKHSNVTLFDLKLIPAAILNFDPEISKQSYLKSEILILAQPLR